jgi:hypothetical protein
MTIFLAVFAVLMLVASVLHVIAAVRRRRALNQLYATIADAGRKAMQGERLSRSQSSATGLKEPSVRIPGSGEFVVAEGVFLGETSLAAAPRRSGGTGGNPSVEKSAKAAF